jgi:adenosylmethionine-8-amino-7-oxononanoate aminotransferase
MNLKQRAKAFLGGTTDVENFLFSSSEGSFIYDTNGKKYIDFLMGWCVGNFGWNELKIKKTITKSNAPHYVYPHYLYEAWVDLAELLADLAPGRLKKSFRATGGSEAVDIALQMAMVHTKRVKFLSIEGAYHGNTIAGVSVGDSESQKPYGRLLSGCLKIAPPLNAKALEKAERLLKKKDVAAFIMEPIVCNLGVLCPEPEFMTGMAQICQKYGTLVIMDEVATGFGRTGKLFASEHFGIEPDIMCVAKAITGGQAPMGATLTVPEVARSAEKEVTFYSTYGWHPLAAEVALTNLRSLSKHKDALLARVEATSGIFRQRLMDIKFKQKAEIRVAGLAIGVELEDGNYTENIKRRSRKEGLLLTAQDNILTMFPALNIDRDVACRGLDILQMSV